MKTAEETETILLHKPNMTGICMIQQDIVKYDLHVKACIQDIRDCEGQIDVLNNINLHISDNMRKMKSAIEDLERAAIEQDSEADRKELQLEVEKHRKQYQANQVALRKANLICQNLIDQLNKEELFYKYSSDGPRQRNKSKADKESLMKQSSQITESLTVINSMITTQLKQSEQTLHTLAGSSANITDTGQELRAMGTTIKHSRKLLHKYGRREITDKVLIILAMIFFFCCILYVVQKRIF